MNYLTTSMLFSKLLSHYVPFPGLCLQINGDINNLVQFHSRRNNFKYNIEETINHIVIKGTVFFFLVESYLKLRRQSL